MSGYRVRHWEATGLLTALALAAWTDAGGTAWAVLALAAAGTTMALVLLPFWRGREDGRRLPLLLALAGLVGGIGTLVAARRIRAVETDWPAVREAMVEDARQRLDATLGEAVDLARALAARSALAADEKPADPQAAECIWKLMEAVDSYIPTPPRPVDKPFLMPIEDIFSITGRGTVVTGRIERGVVKVSEEVEIVGFRDTRKTVVTGVEMFRKLLDEGQAGDNVGCLLRGVDKDEVERGQVLAKPGSIKPYRKFKAEVYVLTKEEGGRHTPFFNGYRPQFYFRTTDVTGVATLPSGREMVMPGDNVDMEVELITPIAMEQGLRFAIREGGRTVGAGVVGDVVA